MSKTRKPNIKKTKPETIFTLLTECGRLKHPLEETLTIVLHSYPNVSRDSLSVKLMNENSEEYKAYQDGLILGDHEIESALHNDARTGDTFAVEALQKKQNDKAVDKAIKENFFPRI